jgi:hypothetical protein
MTLTDLTRAPLPGRGSADLTGQLLEAAARATETSAKAYLDGLDRAVGVQRQLVAGTPFAALSELFAAHASVTRQVLEGSLDLAGKAPSTTAEVVRAAGAGAADVQNGTARVAPKATRRTARAVGKAAKTTRRTAARTTPARTTRAKATPAKATPAKATPAAAVTREQPIAGYDDLTAEQLIAKLPELSQSDLVAVQRYERAQATRATVLERVEALQGAEPAPGYDELTVDDVQKLVAGGPPELATRVRDYERRHKSRAGVLEAADRRIDAA